jgi:quinol monooxygenase YgiN
MVCHIVLYRMKPGTEANDEIRLVEGARSQLPKLPGVKNLRAGRSIEPGSKGYAVALVMDFDDEAAVEAYRINPEHQRFVREVAGPVVSEIVRFDFRW